MKFKLLFFIFLFSTTQLVAQQKYFIYFTDKGTGASKLLKQETLNKTAGNYLSARSIKRRIKTMGKQFFTYEDVPLNAEYLRILRENNIKVDKKLKWFNAVSAFLNARQIDGIKKLKFVKEIIPVKKLIFRQENSDNFAKSVQSFNLTIHNFNYGPSFTQYELSEIPEIHDLGINGKNVIIGILDSGFRWKLHPALANAHVLAEHDFVFNDSVTANQPGDTFNQDSHGTAIFSLIGGFDEGNIVGPAFHSNFVLAKTENVRSETHIEEDNYAAALEWMDSIGVDITTSSLGYSEFDDSTFSYTYQDLDGKTTIVTKAAELAFSRGILTITAAGNEGNKPWHFVDAPADGFNTIAVGAVNSMNVIASFSSRGPTADGRIKPDVDAQGVSDYAASVSGSYETISGTSASTPIVSGIAGLLLSQYPFLSNIQARHILLVTAGNANSPDNDRGYGLVSAKNALLFPAVEVNNNKIVFHKVFLDSAGIDPNTVKIIYSAVNGGKPKTRQLTKVNNYEYNVEFNLSELSGNVEFQFEYNNLAGKHFLDPASEFYNWKSGNEFVEKKSKEIPDNLFLFNNYPNPFNAKTNIKYTIPKFEGTKTVPVKLEIFDVLGRKVTTLVNKLHSPGIYTVEFDTSNLSDELRGLAGGVYFYRLEVGSFFETKKMVLLK